MFLCYPEWHYQPPKDTTVSKLIISIVHIELRFQVPWRNLETLKTPLTNTERLLLMFGLPHTITFPHKLYIASYWRRTVLHFPTFRPPSEQVDLCVFVTYLSSWIYHHEQVSIVFVQTLTPDCFFPCVVPLVGDHRELLHSFSSLCRPGCDLQSVF